MQRSIGGNIVRHRVLASSAPTSRLCAEEGLRRLETNKVSLILLLSVWMREGSLRGLQDYDVLGRQACLPIV